MILKKRKQVLFNSAYTRTLFSSTKPFIPYAWKAEGRGVLYSEIDTQSFDETDLIQNRSNTKRITNHLYYKWLAASYIVASDVT